MHCIKMHKLLRLRYIEVFQAFPLYLNLRFYEYFKALKRLI